MYTYKTRNVQLFLEACDRAEKWLKQVKSSGEFWIHYAYKTHDLMGRKVYVSTVRFVSFYTKLSL